MSKVRRAKRIKRIIPVVLAPHASKALLNYTVQKILRIPMDHAISQRLQG